MIRGPPDVFQMTPGVMVDRVSSLVKERKVVSMAMSSATSAFPDLTSSSGIVSAGEIDRPLNVPRNLLSVILTFMRYAKDRRKSNIRVDISLRGSIKSLRVL